MSKINTFTPITVGNGDFGNKDPRGLVRHDILALREHFKPLRIQPKHSIAEIQFNAGQQSVIEWIENRLVNRT